MQIFKKSLLIQLLIFLNITSCLNENTKESDNQKDTFKLSDELFSEVVVKTKQVFYSLPSPLETAMMIRKTDVPFNEESLNSPENIANYSTNYSRSMNLGIYSSDLCFSMQYKQNQLVIKYLDVIKKLADALNILDAIKKQDIERIEANINDKELVRETIAEIFLNSNSFLREHDRSETVALIVVGGWIEGLYLALEFSNNSVENKKLANRIADQRISLEIIINMLNDYSENQSLQNVNSLLKELNGIFAKMTVNTTAVSETSDDQQISNITLKNKIELTPEILSELREKVKTIRGSFVQ